MTATLEHLDKLYGRAFLDRRYHGIYLNRSPVRHARDVQELYGVPPDRRGSPAIARFGLSEVARK